MNKENKIEERHELSESIYMSGHGLDWQESDDIADQLYAEGYRKQEWISVEDKKPEKHTKVLCYFKYEPESPDVICENLYYSGGLWLSDGSKVTHWMPLPEAPKMKGGAE